MRLRNDLVTFFILVIKQSVKGIHWHFIHLKYTSTLGTWICHIHVPVHCCWFRKLTVIWLTFSYNTYFANLLATSCRHQNHKQDLKNGVRNDYDSAKGFLQGDPKSGERGTGWRAFCIAFQHIYMTHKTLGVGKEVELIEVNKLSWPHLDIASSQNSLQQHSQLPWLTVKHQYNCTTG